jgi:predicted 3-demethylubiquinone-9 3-methyltransferase (glyoxalase superfamily)
MAHAALPFLMFTGRAEEALQFYAATFRDCAITQLERYGAGEAGAEGSVKRAQLRLAGLDLMFFDSPVPHAFGFTPAVSFFIRCEDEAELDDLFARVGADGKVLMPPDNYGFSRKFTWVEDRFGISWQFDLAA